MYGRRFKTTESARSGKKTYGAESFCWASDYPHADGIFLDSQSFIRDTMGHLDDDLRRKLHVPRAAVRLLRHGLAALRVALRGAGRRNVAFN